MNWITTIYIAVLFFVLSPNVLLRIPRKGKPIVVAAVHAVIFALIWHFTGKMVWKASVSIGAGRNEGFREGAAAGTGELKCKSNRGKQEFNDKDCNSQTNGRELTCDGSKRTCTWVDGQQTGTWK
jgi:hypothetical protein